MEDTNGYSDLIKKIFKNYRTVAKLRISGVGSNGGTILTDLIKKGVIEDVSTTEVRLRQHLGLKEGIVREIAKDKFDEIWAILQQSYNDEDGLAPLEIDKTDPLFEYKKLLGDESVPLWRKAALYKKLKWEIVRMNMDFRKEYNEWLNHQNPTMENLRSEYESFCIRWQFPPANPDMSFPNTALFAGSSANPLNIPCQYEKHIQIAAEDKGVAKFFKDEYGHIVSVNSASNDRFDYPVKKIKEGLLGYEYSHNAATINLTINLSYSRKEILEIIENVILEKYQRPFKEDIEDYKEKDEEREAYEEQKHEDQEERDAWVRESAESSDDTDEYADEYSWHDNKIPDMREEDEWARRKESLVDEQREIIENYIDFRDHKKGPEWIDWLVIYKLKSRILKKSELEKEFPLKGGEIFDWLMSEGYFKEKEGVEALLKRLTEETIEVLKNQYHNENKRLIEILTDKYRKWEQIALQFYEKRDIDKDKIKQLQREHKSALKLIKGGYKLIR